MLRTLLPSALAIFCISSPLLAEPAALPAGARVGLYPLQLPDGPHAVVEQLSAQLTAQLKDGAKGLSRINSLEAIAHGACLPDEGGCLAAVARGQSLNGMVAGRVQRSEHGFAFELRLFAAEDGHQLGSQRGSVAGGPLDLAGGLEHGLCELLGGSPCVGLLSVSIDSNTDGAKADAASADASRESSDPTLFIDGKSAGAISSAQKLSLPVGRHLVRVGASEKRVRLAVHRETKLVWTNRDGARSLELVESGNESDAFADAGTSGPGAASAAPMNAHSANGSTSSRSSSASKASAGAARSAAPPSALPDALIPGSESGKADGSPRSRAGWLMIAAGGALLMTATGLEVYARAQSAALDSRYQSGQLTASDSSSYSHVHTAGVAALVLGATGAGALAVGGIVLLLLPDSAAVQGKF